MVTVKLIAEILGCSVLGIILSLLISVAMGFVLVAIERGKLSEYAHERENRFDKEAPRGYHSENPEMDERHRMAEIII